MYRERLKICMYSDGCRGEDEEGTEKEGRIIRSGREEEMSECISE